MTTTRRNAFDEPMSCCPECRSEQVVVTAEQMFMVNTGEHHCHSVKTQDVGAKARCLDCAWADTRGQLVQ